MNVIMRMYSIQQVSWYMGKLVNTSYVAFRRESMLLLEVRPHDNIARALVNRLPVH